MMAWVFYALSFLYNFHLQFSSTMYCYEQNKPLHIRKLTPSSHLQCFFKSIRGYSWVHTPQEPLFFKNSKLRCQLLDDAVNLCLYYIIQTWTHSAHGQIRQVKKGQNVEQKKQLCKMSSEGLCGPWPLLLKRNRLTKELYAERRGGSSCSGVSGLKWVRWEGLVGERTCGSALQSVEDEDEGLSSAAISLLVLLQRKTNKRSDAWVTDHFSLQGVKNHIAKTLWHILLIVTWHSNEIIIQSQPSI